MRQKKQGELHIVSTRWISTARLPSCASEVHSLFDELIHQAWGKTEWYPDIDVVETADAFHVSLDLPGVDEATIQISVQNRHHIIIEGTRIPKAPKSAVQIHINERPFGRFSRTIHFNCYIDHDHIEKAYELGVLNLTVPKLKRD